MKDNFLQQAAALHPHSLVITFIYPADQPPSLAKLNQLIEKITTLAPAAQLLSQHTLHQPWSQVAHTSKVACWQWLINPACPIDKATLTQWRTALSATVASLDLLIEINLTPAATLLRPHRLAVFDMDATLIEQEVIIELARHAGTSQQVSAITEAAMRGELDFCQSLTQRVAMLKGLPVAVLDKIIAHQLTLSDGASYLMNRLKQQGYILAVISGGFDYFADHLRQRLGMDAAFANRFIIANGKLTGEVAHPIIDAKQKAAILRNLAAYHNIPMNQTVAVGDGANDLAMLAAADIGIAYHAKPVVQQQAAYTLNLAGLDGVLPLIGCHW